jgi:hypothetical protein
MSSNVEDLRKEVERSIEKMARANILQEPRNAKVVWNIHPDAIPRNTINAQRLIDGVTKLFGSRFDPSELMKLIPQGVSRDSLSASSLIQMAIDAERLVTFVGGIVKFPDLGRITPIDRLTFGQQTIAATVVGTTDEASLIAKQLCLELWRAAGQDRSWNELSAYVERQTFTTATAVDFGFPLSRLLDPRLSSFLAGELVGESDLGRLMGIQEADSKRQALGMKEKILIPYCHQIRLKVAVIDSVSGRAEDADLDFMIYARTEANRGRVLVQSELPSDKHAELVQRVVALLAN